jgi:hypothetical protein
MGTTSVDPQVLHFAAQRLDEAADILAVALSRHLNRLRLHAADPATRTAMDQLVDGVGQWQRAARQYAAVVRAGADRYIDADSTGAEALR